MGIVSTIPEKCRRCYACVRECPVKAIKVIAGQATVIAEQCIACGNCVKVCTQKAKRIEDATMLVARLLEEAATATRSFACIAPSFPAAFPEVEPGQDRRPPCAAWASPRSGRWPSARSWSAGSTRGWRGRPSRAGQPVVSTPCPAIVSYVQKYMPALHGALAPVVSPMIAVARAIRRKHGAGVRVVFIGPCIAKKAEIKDPFVQGTVDAVLTYEELLALFAAAGIDPRAEPPGAFDGPAAYLGRSIPISGGLLRAAGFDADILQNSVLVTEGKDRVLPALKELAEGTSKARVLDVLFCEGCINGPEDDQHHERLRAQGDAHRPHQRAATRSMAGRDMQETLCEFDDVDLRREFLGGGGGAAAAHGGGDRGGAAPDAEVRPRGPAQLRLLRLPDLPGQGRCGLPGVCRGEHVPALPGGGAGGDALQPAALPPGHAGQAGADGAAGLHGPDLRGGGARDQQPAVHDPPVLAHAPEGAPGGRPGVGGHPDDRERGQPVPLHHAGLLDFARQSRVVKTATDLGLLVQRPGGRHEHEAGRRPRSRCARRSRRACPACCWTESRSGRCW